MAKTLVRPVPLDNAAWAPAYTRNRGDANVDKAYTFADAQGMCCLGGRKVHGGWDIFAPAGTPVLSPADGVVVRADESSDHYGPVYGGNIGVRFPDGSGMLARHIDPSLRVGARVEAGDIVGHVFNWHSGGDHLHLELHRRIGNGYDYRFANTIDPGTITWVEASAVPKTPEPEPVYGLEILPMRLGGFGPDIYGGWMSRAYGDKVERILDARHGDRATPVRLDGAGPPYGVVVWSPGRYGGIPRWLAPTETERAVIERRVKGLGAPYRKFRGIRNSHYARLP